MDAQKHYIHCHVCDVCVLYEMMALHARSVRSKQWLLKARNPDKREIVNPSQKVKESLLSQYADVSTCTAVTQKLSKG